MPFSNQCRRIILHTEKYGIKDTNSRTIKPDNFNVYTDILA